MARARNDAWQCVTSTQETGSDVIASGDHSGHLQRPHFAGTARASPNVLMLYLGFQADGTSHVTGYHFHPSPNAPRKLASILASLSRIY